MKFPASFMPCKCLRWAFRVNHWNPTSEEWLRAMESIQVEEVSRINKFHFREDAKSATVGRLMLRRAVTEQLNLDWKNVRFGRTEKGKPVLLNEQMENFSFNISHQGDLVILAALTGSAVGVDVMKIETARGSKGVQDYLNLMKRQFSRREFESFDKMKEDGEKLALFYRYWCLKESYIKALGTGIHKDLSSLDFQINSFELTKDKITNNTKLFSGNFDDQQQEEKFWKFEESLIDDDHIAAVCIEASQAADCYYHSETGILFNWLNIGDLLNHAEPLHVVAAQEFQMYLSKSSKSV